MYCDRIMGIRVEGHSDLERDESSGAIVNTNIEQWKLAKLRKQRFKQQRTSEINNLKEEVSEIKSMLTQLMEKENLEQLTITVL